MRTGVACGDGSKAGETGSLPTVYEARKPGLVTDESDVNTTYSDATPLEGRRTIGACGSTEPE